MGPPMSDEFIEEMAVRAAQENMDEAFRAAMQKGNPGWQGVCADRCF